MAKRWEKRGEQRTKYFRLFQNSAVFTKDVIFGDYFWYTFGLADIATTENKDFIGVKDGIAVLVKDDQFIAVFFSDLLLDRF